MKSQPANLFFLFCFLIPIVAFGQDSSILEKPISSKIPILNFATFHMGATSDAHKTEFDETDKKNIEETKKISQLLAAFKPTIICVEVPPKNQKELNEKYREYLSNPDIPSTYYGEVGLVAFEIARSCGIDSLHAIDHKMSYNFQIANDITNEIDPSTYTSYFKNPLPSMPSIMETFDTLSTIDKLKVMNTTNFLDFLMTINADILSHVGTKGNFEGADEAAKYYQRNLRMYSNLNRIKMGKEDRVFILLGGSHTAFFRDFIKRSPKYQSIRVSKFLK